MPGFIFILFTIILLGLAIAFLIAALIFRKKRALKWIFGILSFITIMIYIKELCFSNSPDWLVYRSFSGKFHNAQTDTWIYLNADRSWTTDAGLFKCTQGKWKYTQTEEFALIMMEGICESGTDFIQIPVKDSDKLTFSPQDTRTFTGNELTYSRE